MTGKELKQKVVENVGKVIVGKNEIITLLLTAILAEGHVLLEDVPGTGKTKIAKSLAKLSEGRTTLTIAHRLSSIKNSDRILVLTEEGIVEEGNHDSLLEKKGIYHHFYTTANALK